jgi:5-(carboxyamino)imidazole ribonucleotide mutase
MADPIVGVVMGSDSDLAVMAAASEVLAELGIAAETRVVSAHRTPTDMITYGQSAEARGLRGICRACSPRSLRCR